MSASTAAKAEEQPVVTLEEAISLAKGHHQIGNYILAERTYRDILRAVPDNFQATHFLGILLFQNGNQEEALIYLKKATELEPDNVHAWNNYGAVLTQRGEHEEALSAYEHALKISPQYSDALNNKTHSLWSLKRYDESEAIARKILELEPDNPNALINLGITLARQEKYEDALNIWEQAAEKHPDNPDLYNNWGNTLREMGRIAASEEKCRKALELQPENHEAINNLANTLRDLGQVDEAIELYKQATDLRPEFYTAHNNLAIAYLDQLEYKRASIAARYAIAFKNDFAEAHSSLCRALINLGDYDHAHSIAQKAIYLSPDSADPYLDLSEVLLRADRLSDGEAALQEAINRDPDSPRAYLKLCDIRDQMNEVDEALEAIDKALEIAPDMPALMMRKAQLLHSSNRVPQALEIIETVISLAPNYLAAYQAKAEMLIAVNKKEEAEKTVRFIMKGNKKIPAPYYTLSGIKTVKSKSDKDYQNLAKMIENADSHGLEGRALMNYAMAKMKEQLKDYDGAFEHLKEANDYKRKMIPYDSSTVPAKYNGLKRRYNEDFFKEYEGEGSDSDTPVFIVGMPRSGTTLTEQIISSHPDVYGAGELTDLGRVIRSMTPNERPDLKALGDQYVTYASSHEKAHLGKNVSKRITDKMPGNYMSVGLISVMLPNAKIIHCKRNPIDTCLSCYKQNFARGQYWSYDLEELADEYLRYTDLMEHWRTALPGKMLEIDYEETVNDLEGQARKLIDFIGLDWNDACLEPHKQKRTVLTASKAQVTKPVYTTSVDKWKRFEKQLQPLVRKLMPEKALPES